MLYGVSKLLRGKVGKPAFALAYCLTVLPFTVRFFEGFVSPPQGFWRDLYLVALPAFLFSLEYAGISLAILFWRERKAEFLSLFAACQALAVFSTFYDVRAAEWDGLVAVRSQAIRSVNAGRIARQEETKRKRYELTERLKAISAEAASTRAAMGTTSAAGSSDPFADPDLESRKLGQREKVLGDYRASLADDRKEAEALRQQIKGTYEEPEAVDADSLPGTDAPTALAYVGHTLTEGPSFVALGLSFLFPLTVLAMGRVLSASEAPVGPAASADLRRELAEGAALPEARHDSFASLMEPVIHAHVASIRAARSAAARGLALSVEMDAEIDVLASVVSLRDQVETSELSASARERLASFIDRLLAEEAGPAPSAA